MKRNFLRLWANPFPAVFGLNSAAFLPEVQPGARYSTYEDLEFDHFDQRLLQACWVRAVLPVCVLLNETRHGRGRTDENCVGEALSRLLDGVRLDEDERFDAQITAALSALAAIRVYNLRRGGNPKIAASVI